MIVLERDGELVSISPQAEHWLAQLTDPLRPRHPHEADAVQVVAACVRAGGTETSARVRVRTRTGQWLLVFGTTLTGHLEDAIGVVVQPAAPQDTAPLVAAAYGFTDRERRVTELCGEGMSTKQIAAELHMSAYTVQDHFKSVFEKTGARSRAELVGRVFVASPAPQLAGARGGLVSRPASAPG